MQMRDFVVRFAGEGGQGVVTSAEGLAQASTQVGYHALTYATFPSQILGGPTWTQARISTETVLSAGDNIDVLVAFNEEAYENHRSEVRDGGVIIFNSNDFEIENNPQSFGLPIDELARTTVNNRAANMIVIGALAHLVNMPQQFLKDFVTDRFTRGRDNDEEIIKSNHQALDLGRSHAAESGFNLGELADPIKPDYQQVMMKGNEAISVGAIAAGLNFYAGYPISPATTVLLYMERNLHGEGKFVYQVGSEIEAITALIGGGYAGKKAMTATAGPGFSLMSEGIGLGQRGHGEAANVVAHLIACGLQALVGLDMRSQTYAVFVEIPLVAVEIVLQPVQIDDQGGRVDILNAHVAILSKSGR